MIVTNRTSQIVEMRPLLAGVDVDARDRTADVIERPLDAPEQLGAQQQVLRRIARQAQFREDDGIGLLRVAGPWE